MFSGAEEDVAFRHTLLTLTGIIVIFLACLAVLRYGCIFCIDTCLLAEGPTSVPVLSFFRVHLFRSFHRGRGDADASGGRQIESSMTVGGGALGAEETPPDVDESLTTTTTQTSTDDVAVEFLRLTQSERGDVIDSILPCKRATVELISSMKNSESPSSGLAAENGTGAVAAAANEITCPICLNEFVPDQLILTPQSCSHWFHRECLHGWLNKSGCCPCCRAVMISRSELKSAAAEAVVVAV